MKKSYSLLVVLSLSTCCVKAMDFERWLLPQRRGEDYGAITQRQKDIDFFILLPREVQQKIAASMLYTHDLCEENTKKIFNNPLCSIVLHMKFCDELSELKKFCPLKIGNKGLSFVDLLQLPRKEKNELIEKVTPTFFSKITGSHCIFEPEELDNLTIFLPYDLLNGLQVRVFRKVSCLEKHASKIICGVVMSVGGIAVIGGVASNLPPLWMPGLVIMLVGPPWYFMHNYFNSPKTDIISFREEV